MIQNVTLLLQLAAKSREDTGNAGKKQKADTFLISLHYLKNRAGHPLMIISLLTTSGLLISIPLVPAEHATTVLLPVEP
jgi:hypothetical protein